MLTKVSTEAYTLIRDLCNPIKPKSKPYAELVKLVQEHLCPKPSEAIERCKFNLARQDPTETVAEFSARLKKIAINCNFENLQTSLRDQLICGIKNRESKVELFKE